jgi:hypothetical protein
MIPLQGHRVALLSPMRDCPLARYPSSLGAELGGLEVHRMEIAQEICGLSQDETDRLVGKGVFF